MKTIIAGSRTCHSYQVVKAAVDQCGFEITEILSGNARGVDHLGEMIGYHRGIPVKRFPADWKTHGKAAGAIRNLQMSEEADALIAVWDGKSRGTKHMIDTAYKKGLLVYVYPA